MATGTTVIGVLTVLLGWCAVLLVLLRLGGVTTVGSVLGRGRVAAVGGLLGVGWLLVGRSAVALLGRVGGVRLLRRLAVGLLDMLAFGVFLMVIAVVIVVVIVMVMMLAGVAASVYIPGRDIPGAGEVVGRNPAAARTEAADHILGSGRSHRRHRRSNPGWT